MLELFADDAFGRKPQSVSVEFERCFQIVDTKRDDTDASFHFDFSFLYSELAPYRLDADVVAGGTEKAWCGLPWRERPALKISAKTAEAADPNGEQMRRPRSGQTDEG
ncbi:Uncharacterized protein MLTONO_7148 [Mesorhizobium loti]|nr:Uncharacterized protein MLTONO_7148 [Mesorhizobium loti]